MAKLTRAQNQAFYNACEDLATLETRVFFSRSVGMMLAIMPTPTERKDGHIIFEITVALCHPNDEFKEQLGLIELYDNYDNMHSTMMRIEHNDFEGFAERIFDYEPFEELELN